jgi:hypothetical protein
VRRIAILKTSLRRRKKKKKKKSNNKNNNNNKKPQQKSPKQTMASEPDCAAVCALFAATERAHSAPDVMWVCAWCLV